MSCSCRETHERPRAPRLGWVPRCLAAAFFLLFLLLPLGESLRGAFFDVSGRPTLAYVSTLFQSGIYLEGFRNAVILGVCSTLLAAAVGLPMAWIMDRYDFPGRRLLGALLPLPLLVPPFVGAIGIKQIFGQSGALNALLVGVGLQDSARPDRLASPGPLRRGDRAHFAPPLSHSLLQRLRCAFQRTARDGGSCRKLRRDPLVETPQGDLAARHAQHLRLGHHRVHLGPHRARRPLDVRLHADHVGADFLGLKDIGRNPLVYALVTVVLIATLFFYVVARRAFGRNAAMATSRALRSASCRRSHEHRASSARCFSAVWSARGTSQRERGLGLGVGRLVPDHSSHEHHPRALRGRARTWFGGPLHRQ